MVEPVIIGDALSLDEARRLTSSQRHRLRKRGVDVPRVPQKAGFTQTPEHIEKRKRCGPLSYQWAGDEVSVTGGRKRALKAFPKIGPCIKCGNPKSERHHKDENTANNQPDNIEVLCRKCHMLAHKEMRRCRTK